MEEHSDQYLFLQKSETEQQNDITALVAETILSAVIFVLLIALGIKVFKIVKFSNKWLLSMMVALNLCVLILMVFSSLEANYLHNLMQHE